MISKGIWVPADNILAANQEVAAKRATIAYGNERKRDLARRQATQTAYTQDFNDQSNIRGCMSSEAVRLLLNSDFLASDLNDFSGLGISQRKNTLILQDIFGGNIFA
nr:hypothetical protein [uncultured Desulfobacter sp.]